MRRIMILATAAALFVAACGGGGNGATATTVGDTTGAPAGGVAAAGDTLFASSCASCHGPDAAGLPGLGKNLVGSEFVTSMTDAELVDFIKQGRPASHPDNEAGVDMPPKGGNPSLDDQDILDIVAYLRTLR